MLTADGLNEDYDFSNPLPDSSTGFRGVWYVAERAKSGRSQCRSCRKQIANQSLRIGVNQDVSSEQRGTSCGFFHPSCFFQVLKDGKEYWARKVTSTDQIQNYQLMSSTHKSELQKYIPGGGKGGASKKAAAPTPVLTTTSTFPKNANNVLFRYDSAKGFFVAIGNTRPVKEEMKEYGGAFDYREKYWYFEDGDEIEDLVGTTPKKSPSWSKELTVSAIQSNVEGAGEDSDDDEDSEEDFEEDSEEDSDEDSDDSEEEEAPTFYAKRKSPFPTPKSAPPPKKTCPAPFFKPASTTPAQSTNFAAAKATNFEYLGAPSPSLPTEVVYPKLQLEKGGVSLGKMGVCKEPLPQAKTSGTFAGNYIYFVPGCLFATPTARLKKVVRENGGVIVSNISLATHIISTREKVNGGFGGDSDFRPARVVSDGWITDSVARGGRYVNDYVLS